MTGIENSFFNWDVVIRGSSHTVSTIKTGNRNNDNVQSQ